MSQALSARDRLMKAYNDAAGSSGREFYARTRPYHSTQILRGKVVAADQTAEANVAFVTFLKGQVLSFFDYGVGNPVQLMGAPNGQRPATQADTNLVKAKQTNGASDFAIEGISMGYRASLITYSEEAIAQITNTSNEIVLASLGGESMIVDPASIATPPQMQSPFNGEISPLYFGIANSLSVEMQWDGGTPTFKLGCADMFPDASAKSQLRAAGMPMANNCYQISEGYVWRKSGQTESELVVNATLQESVTVPINLPVNPESSTDAIVPTDVAVLIVCRLWGMEFCWQGING